MLDIKFKTHKKKPNFAESLFLMFYRSCRFCDLFFENHDAKMKRFSFFFVSNMD